jgi:hypothetical protein
MEKFLIMESGYKKVNPKMRKMGYLVKWLLDIWTSGKLGKVGHSYVDKVAMWTKWPRRCF